jgi:hypothetical protein
MADQIRYDLLTQQALRGVVRHVLTDAAKKGLPGDHHFYISFDTHADGVRLSERLRAQYPEEMTIILQHQFWDLAVSEQGFEVGMSFGGIPEKLYIPFVAIRGFFDPSVQFGLQFEDVAESQDAPAKTAKKTQLTSVDGPGKSTEAGSKIDSATAATVASKPAAKPTSENGRGSSQKSSLLPMDTAPTAAIPPVSPLPPEEPAEPKPNKPSGGGEVVSLDRFRKK